MNAHPQDSAYTPPREYQHLMRGPRFAWWRPLVAFLLAACFLLLAVILMGIAVGATGRSLAIKTDEMTVPVFALVNLLLASLIPAAMLSTRIAHGTRAGFLSSVTGGFRWRWMLRCLSITAPLYIVLALARLVTDWPPTARPQQWALLLLLVFVGTPLQSAGEEYIARGLIQQNVGAWFRNPRTAMLVATLVSTVLFLAAHGSPDPWILLDLGAMAVGCSILVWRTGGLEAAIVLHAVNNVTGMADSIVFGGWGENFVRETSKGKPLEALTTVVIVGIVVVLTLRRARLDGIQRVYQTVADPVGASPAASWRPPAVTPPRVALALTVIVTNLWAACANLPHQAAGRLPKLRYADIATAMGVTPDGCIKGNRVESLPIEIRRYATRELVGDDVHLTLGEVVLPGSNGVFEFPLSAQLMRANPDFWVVQSDGRRIDYRYQFLPVTVRSKGTCGSGKPQPPAG